MGLIIQGTIPLISMLGDGHANIVGFFIPYTQGFHSQGGMTIPNIATFDPDTYGILKGRQECPLGGFFFLGETY